MSSAQVPSTAQADASWHEAVIRAFKAMMSIPDDEGNPIEADPSVTLGDLEALQGVVKFPVRIKCATLAWNTLLDALAAG